MAKKPAKIFKATPGVYSPPKQNHPTVARGMRPPTTALERVPIYRDGANRDRLSITQQVVEGAGGYVSRSRDAGNAAYEELLYCIYDGVLITDLDGNIKEVNDRAEHYFMWTKNELREGNIVQLISGADERLLIVLRENIDNKKYSVLEAICVCGDESRFNAEIVVNRLGGRKIAFFIRNITERKRVEEELKQANDKLIEAEKMQSRMDTLSTLFYELNNPLQILTCMAELDKNDEYRKQLGRIVSVLEHLRKQESLEAVVDDEVGTRYHVPTPAAELKNCDGKRLLVVDDEAMLREMFVTSLKTALRDATVDSAGDGRQAVDAFVRDHHGLIIMDVSMPVMNGEQAFGEIKAVCEKTGYRMPAFIFCTGFVVSDGLQAIIDEDPSRSCLQKPMSINDLIEAVKKRLIA
jgi:PAS domain S-box-containing protein